MRENMDQEKLHIKTPYLDTFHAVWDRYYKVGQLYYRMGQVTQSGAIITKKASTPS